MRMDGKSTTAEDFNIEVIPTSIITKNHLVDGLYPQFKHYMLNGLVLRNAIREAKAGHTKVEDSLALSTTSSHKRRPSRREHLWAELPEVGVLRFEGLQVIRKRMKNLFPVIESDVAEIVHSRSADFQPTISDVDVVSPEELKRLNSRPIRHMIFTERPRETIEEIRKLKHRLSQNSTIVIWQNVRLIRSHILNSSILA